ncbi:MULTISPECIES: urease accessory protein UreE [Kaistia]|uniref:Urease accessory protein UreE n=1 Tax=Kaistia nematophila TaxID=2994654 RepID=A0A9X3INC6_9HYPH|nr:urease accessory protein UreE [Kaistia nematophila]MCX5571847.1 urease accessory protein UreE [Kaistia nematophila]
MILIESTLGNIQDPEWAKTLEGAAVDWLELDQWEAQKSRLRKATQQDVELALSLDRNSHLHDGDILVWDEAKRAAIVARITLREVMIITLDDVVGETIPNMVQTLFELGHALGNQHWPAVVKGTKVYVPLTVDKKVMNSVMKTHALPGVRHEFMPGSEVIPYLAPHESRRLFGGASDTPHSHHHASKDAHGHGHDHGHSHGHAHAHDH